MLAEISDKMPTILELWGLMLLFSAPFLLGLAHRWIALLGLLVALPFAASLVYSAYAEAFLEGSFRRSWD
ncbi:MAG: hypothetical protein RL095_3521 [Verrucomicrobiota bacterium]|jgi:hypothetical protein